MTALICVWKPGISSYYHTCRGRKCHWAVGRSVAWRHFKGTYDRAGLLAFFFRIYANQKPRKNSIDYGHSSGKPGCGARVQEHRHAPEIGHKAGVRGQDRSLLRSSSGRSHAILSDPHESVSIRHTFLKFLFHCFAVCQLVPMGSSFYCLLLYTLHQSQENPYRPVTRRVIMKRDGRYSKENLGKQQ